MNDENPWGAPSSPSPPTAPLRHDSPSEPIKLDPYDDDDWGSGDLGVLPPPVTASTGGPRLQEPETETAESKEVEKVGLPSDISDDSPVTGSVPLVSITASPLSLPSMDQGPPMDDFDDDIAEAVPVAKDGDEGSGFGDAIENEDEFDDFGDMGGGDGDDDDFGEFGGDEAFGAAATTFEQQEAPPVASTSSSPYAPPFRLDLSKPTRSSLGPQLAQFLQSAYPNAAVVVSDEPERQVDGVGQILVTESSRALLSTLSSLPPLRPLDWRRSKVRREHLIALGVPVNLDDSTEARPLASLVLPSLRTSSPSRYPHSINSAPTHSGSQLPFSSSPVPSRSSTPTLDHSPRQPPRRGTTPAPPSLDKRRAEEVCSIESDDLSLLSLAQLQAMKAELEKLSIDASGVLTHALLLREKEVGDGETYHGMIQDLVKAAARTKTTMSNRSSGSQSIRGGRWSVGAVRKSSGGTSAVR